MFKGQTNSISALALSDDGDLLVTGSDDKFARLWDFRSTNSITTPKIVRGQTSMPTAVALSIDNHWLVTGSQDNTACLWDLLGAPSATSQPIVLRGNTDAVIAVAISHDIRWVIAGSRDKTACLWDMGTSDPKRLPVYLKGHINPVYTLGFSPNSRWCITASSVEHQNWQTKLAVETAARLWDMRATNPATNPILLQHHVNEISLVTFSPDSRWALTGGGKDGSVGIGGSFACVWDLRSEDPSAKPLVLSGHDMPVRAAAFSPDSRWVATGSEDRSARLWDLKDANPAAHPLVFKGHDGYIRAVCFSPDGRWLVTGCDDHYIRLWDLTAPDPTAKSIALNGHANAVAAVRVTRSGRWLTTVDRNGTACRWVLQIEDLLTLARVTAGRNLSTNEWNTFLPGQPYFEVFPGLHIPKY